MLFDRRKVGEAAKEIADHLQLVENVRALQSAQKDLADALSTLGTRLREIEADMRVLKAETKLESLKETQSLVNAVQGGMNERIDTLAIKVALLDKTPAEATKKLR